MCLKEANREKINKTPWEAWGDKAQWNAIATNLKNLPDKKARRFALDAIEWFEGGTTFKPAL